MPVPGFWLATYLQHVAIFQQGSRMNKKIALLLMIFAVGAAPSSWAANGIAIEAGHGDATDMGQISLIRQWDHKWFTDGDWYLTGYWEVSAGNWKSSSAGGKRIWDVGFTPVFRLQTKASSGFRPYVDGAVGAHLISDTHVNDNLDMGSSFEFGSHVGLGLLFGDKSQFDLGYRYQHLSNADLKTPNPGIEFQQVRFAYLF
jgi:lipid A 3-O-deacylase